MAVTRAVEVREAPLSPGQKLVLGAEIVATYVRVRWLLKRLDLPATVRALRSVSSVQRTRGRAGSDDEVVGVRLGGAVVRVLGLLPSDSRCLVSSLVLTRLLARRGISVAVVIGVAAEPTFAAHAWVERGDVPLLPPREPNFSRLVRL
jgi:hypothetical protein